jgi:hypothetical protein
MEWNGIEWNEMKWNRMIHTYYVIYLFNFYETRFVT